MTQTVLYDTGSDPGKIKVLPDPPVYVPQPLWQPFPGFSFLFDNPGASLQRHERHELLHVGEDCIKNIDLYEKITEAVKRIDPAALAQRFLFFALPSNTYHVTVWDGVNKGNVERLDPDSRRQFDHCFAQGIDGVIRNWPPFDECSDYPGVFDSIGSIRFRYKGLRSRGSTVLVVDLEADQDDDESCRVLEEIIERRQHLDEMFANYGKPENYMLRPHVAIGYFSDSHLGGKALYQHMDTWMSVFDQVVKGSVIEFGNISLYAFLNMITYFKPVKE